MADVGISYSHSDTAEALDLRAECLQAGLTVWMDDSGTRGDTASDIGIPIGLAHRSVIEREFASAFVIIALDTPSWRSSDYCRRENELCETLGKWIVRATPGTIANTVSDIAAVVRQRANLLAAHARIATRVIAGDPPRTRLRRWQGQSLSTDARTLLGSDLIGSGLSLTAPIETITASDLRDARDSRRRRRTASVAVVGALGVLAVGAGVAWILATRFSADAIASAHRAQALAVISKSADNPDTLGAISQARQAVQLDPGGPGVAALAAARTADERLRTIVLRPDSYLGAVWAPSSPEVLAYTDNHIVAVNSTTGVTKKQVVAKDSIYPGSLVAGPGAKTAIYKDFSNNLVWLDLATGDTHQLGIGSVTSLKLSADGLLWWGTSESTLSWAPYPATGSLAGVQTVTLPTPAEALDVVSSEVGYVGANATVHVLTRSGSSLEPGPSIALNTTANPLVGAYRESITDCGGMLYGAYTPGAIGVTFAWNPKTGSLATGATTRASSPVCADGTAWASDATRGYVEDPTQNIHLTLTDDTNRYFAASDPEHTRVAELSPAPSRLFVIDPHTMTTVDERDEQITGQVVFDNRVWLVGPGGQLVDEATGALGGRLPGVTASEYSLASYVSRIGGDAIVTTNESFYHVARDGTATRLGLNLSGIRNIRAGSDGKHFVLTTTTSVELLNPDGTVAKTVGASWATAADQALDADISPDGAKLAVVDSLGRIRSVNLAHPGKWTSVASPIPAGESQISFTRSGELVVLGSDQRLRLITVSGTTRAALQTAIDNERLRIEGGEIIVSSLNGAGFTADERTLAVTQQLPSGLFDVQSDGELRGLAVYSASEGAETTASSAATIAMPPVAGTKGG